MTNKLVQLRKAHLESLEKRYPKANLSALKTRTENLAKNNLGPLSEREKGYNFAKVEQMYDDNEALLGSALKSVLSDATDKYMQTLGKALNNGDAKAVLKAGVKKAGEVDKVIAEYAKKSYLEGVEVASGQINVAKAAIPLAAVQLINASSQITTDTIISDIENESKALALNGLESGINPVDLTIGVSSKVNERVDRLVENTTSLDIGYYFGAGLMFIYLNSGEVVGFERSERLDKKTCHLCASWHGRTVKADDPMAKLHLFHSSCRGQWIPITKDQQPQEFETIPGSVRAPFDTIGGVPLTNGFKQLKKPILN